MKYLFYILIIVVSFSCRKQKIKQGQKRLPNKTEKGKGMFACYMNEQTFIFKKQGEIVYNSTTGYLALNIIGRNNKEFRFFIYEDLFSTGLYKLSLTGEEYIPYKNAKPYYLIENAYNQVEITKLDLEFRIIAGTFNLDLINNENEKIEVRDGRFDLKLKIIN